MNQRLHLATLGGLLLLLLQLSACGPGTGGTGSGFAQDHLAQAGASAAPVCGASWANNLDCPPSQGATSTEQQTGTLRVVFASAGSNPEFVAIIEGNHIELLGGCPSRSFIGDWGQVGNADKLFFGAWVEPSQVAEQTARLSVQGAEANQPAALLLELRTPDGRLLLGPLRLARVSGAEISPRACG